MNKKIFLGTTILASIFCLSNICYATNIENLDAETFNNIYEANDGIMPASYSASVSESILESYSEINSSNILQKAQSNINSIKVGASAESSSYDLGSKMSISVKDQQNTEECWAFSLITSMETNSKLVTGTSKNFSVRHMDYATSNSFYDGTNELGFNRLVSDGGNFIIGLSYLTNGQGAVLEEEMPFENNMNNISLNQIDIDPSYYVKGYEVLPSIYKINTNGETQYTDGTGNVYSYDEVVALRKIIKQHIINYGAITAYTASSSFKSFSSSDIISSQAYYCNDMNIPVDHAVTIVGWDDTYSKDNFTGSAKPSRDGAYLVLNSYSDKYFNEGYIWISYEDVWIESSLYGITKSDKINYDELYQHDFYGANIPITLLQNGQEVQESYLASIYKRESNIEEILNEVAISTNQYASFDIYVNPKNGETDINNMEKVASTNVLNPGYNTISISPVSLTGDEFSIVVKQKAVDETVYFMIEAEVDETFYSNASANLGDSKVSLDGLNWVNLADLGIIEYQGFNIDLSKADVCVKGFTTYKDVSSVNYSISQDNYITKIYDNTKISDFLNNISITKDYKFIDSKGNEITDNSTLVATGMILEVNGNNYILVVRGDINGDGKISLIDVSKQFANYSGISKFILAGAYQKACDINLDDEVSIIDLSKFLVLYNNK